MERLAAGFSAGGNMDEDDDVSTMHNLGGRPAHVPVEEWYFPGLPNPQPDLYACRGKCVLSQCSANNPVHPRKELVFSEGWLCIAAVTDVRLSCLKIRLFTLGSCTNGFELQRCRIVTIASIRWVS